jgi:alkanesulfonate monooxygenase SsuD/methylene tetrahydromethanopterin reductase-like flavin-dependent oxidoreductase (luciferase family)
MDVAKVSSSDTALGLGLLGYAGVREQAAAAAAAEAAGFTSAWAMETRITRDAVTGMTAMLLATSTLRVGCAGVNPFTRGAALIATTWAALAEAAPGRAMLGVSIGSAWTLAQQGLHVDHAIGRLRELVEAVRAAWSAPAPVDYAGRYAQLHRLEPELRPSPPPPVHFAVGGPQALTLAARIGDGILLDCFLSAGVVGRMADRVHTAAGGHFGGPIGAALMVSVADDERTAAARLKPAFASYVARYPELAREMDLDAESLAAAGAGAVPDEIVLDAAVCGPPDRCRARIAEYRDAGVHEPVLCPEPLSLEPTIRLLGGS